MTAAALARLIAQRTARMQPETARAWLRAVDILRRTLNVEQIAALIASGRFDAILTDGTIERALIPLRDAVQEQTAQGFRQSVGQLPAGGLIDGAVGVQFNVLNPRVRTALQLLEQQILATRSAEIRETVRQAVAAGVDAGQGPLEIARGIRAAVGLAPHQELAVRNFERALREGDVARALGYKLRDRRYDRSVRRGVLSEAQIDTMVKAYRKRFEAHHAETVARTATLNAYRAGQHEAFAAAIDAGIVDRARAVKTWLNVGDSRVRDEHQNAPAGVGGETVSFFVPFSNGLDYPNEYNCRCNVRYWQRPA